MREFHAIPIRSTETRVDVENASIQKILQSEEDADSRIIKPEQNVQRRSFKA